MITFLKRYKLEILMITPLVAYILGLTFIPVLQCIYYSFQSRAGMFPTLENYRMIIGAGRFAQAFFNTMAITAIGLSLEMSVGLGVALILSFPTKFKGFLRGFVMTPLGIPTIVSSSAMLYIFSSQGYLNEFLYRIGMIKIPIDWASGGLHTIFMIAFADMWKVTPMVIIILLAGLESIPGSIYEASAIDGASGWTNFRYITLPMMKPFITIALILRAIDAFRIFELPFILAGNNTMVLGTFAYNEYFYYNNVNTSSAASVILTFIIAVFVVLYMGMSGAKSGVEEV